MRPENVKKFNFSKIVEQTQESDSVNEVDSILQDSVSDCGGNLLCKVV